MKRCLIVIDMQNGVFSLKRPVYRKDAHSTFYVGPEKVIGRVSREMERAGARLVSADKL